MMVKCQCGREWPCPHIPTSWHTPAGVHVEDIDLTVSWVQRLLFSFDEYSE